jgi:hypothetical protein
MDRDKRGRARGASAAAAAAAAATADDAGGEAASEPMRVNHFFRAEGVACPTGTGAKVIFTLSTLNAKCGATAAGNTEAQTVLPGGAVAFHTPVEVAYYFERTQRFIITWRGGGTDGRSDEFTLGAVMGKNHTASLRVPLAADGAASYVTVTGEERQLQSSATLRLQFAAAATRKRSSFRENNSYLRLVRLLPSGAEAELFRSPAVPQTCSPAFAACPPFRISELCGGGRDAKTLRVEVWDTGRVAGDALVGLAFLSVAECLGTLPGGGRTPGNASFSRSTTSRSGDAIDAAANGCSSPGGRDSTGSKYAVCLEPDADGSARASRSFPLRKPSRGNEPRGTLMIVDAVSTRLPTFLDFLRAGLNINLVVAVDFAASNGDPASPSSLHYVAHGRNNQYQRAIRSVGDVLIEYDTDKRVPVYGFGAATPHTAGAVSHHFPLTLEDDANVEGVGGIMRAYAAAVPQLAFGAPTNFCPTVAAIAKAAVATPAEYTILLILTDGEINDMNATIDAVVGADDAPLSIIIVGVGSACDFTNMDQLDGDEVRLAHTATGRASRRDLVQFVPYAEYAAAAPATLAAEVLREVPDQVARWAALSGSTPAGWNDE